MVEAAKHTSITTISDYLGTLNLAGTVYQKPYCYPYRQRGSRVSPQSAHIKRATGYGINQADGSALP